LRRLRGVGLAAAIAAMPLYLHRAPTGQKPRPPRIVPPLAGIRAATLRTMPPVPGGPLR
jgi:hypothetical protein